MAGRSIRELVEQARHYGYHKGGLIVGSNPAITADDFPRQSRFVGRRVEVVFHRDTSRRFDGTIVRDDVGEPARLIIKLDDGRYVLSEECQYRLP
jgi:hypothetical protein